MTMSTDNSAVIKEQMLEVGRLLGIDLSGMSKHEITQLLMSSAPGPTEKSAEAGSDSEEGSDENTIFVPASGVEAGGVQSVSDASDVSTSSSLPKKAVSNMSTTTAGPEREFHAPKVSGPTASLNDCVHASNSVIMRDGSSVALGAMLDDIQSQQVPENPYVALKLLKDHLPDFLALCREIRRGEEAAGLCCCTRCGSCAVALGAAAGIFEGL